ncbi:hypothetical protein HOY80DRAFT_386830 [Tuber brumale]|nr:hypothetical protein HOY80DRAFT_386830 [Tuber brumale]
MFLTRALWSALWIPVSALALAQTNTTIRRFGAKTVEPEIDKQTWNWGPDSRCRLLAHESIIVNYKEKDLLIFDGDPRTVIVDLSKPFTSRDFVPISQPKKPPGVPIVNRFGLWIGSNQGRILMQGGHFYEAKDWRNSSYFLEKKDIPGYNIWKYDLETLTWTETSLPTNTSSFKRAFGGAAVSVPSTDKSYYIGGLWTPRSSSDSPNGSALPQSGMLVYDHKTNILKNESFGEPGMAYWHGSANHLKIGNQTSAGFLIALMAETAPGGVPIKDDLDVNDEHGSTLSFEYVMFYDLDNKNWINQSTTFYNREVPVPRTRFCGQTVYSDETKTWELWIHGGMLMEPLGEAVPDAWILTMPSFIWTRVQIPESMARMRSHTCNAVGSQLLILGGYPPSAQVEQDAPCDSELIKVLDMNAMTWSSHYAPGTVYKTPELVRKNAEFHLGRVDPQSGWADDRLRDAFYISIGHSARRPILSGAEKAGIVVSLVIGLPLLALFIFYLIFKSLPRWQWPPWPPRPPRQGSEDMGRKSSPEPRVFPNRPN